MPIPASVFRVMIASPSDVSEEKQLVRQSIDTWNSTHAITRRSILLCVDWELASAPTMGNHPQAILNEQLGLCDVLIGVFWSRLGTPTETAPSGPVEEIERHIAAGKLVMLYFSDKPAMLSGIDLDQLQAVRYAKEKYKKRGLVDTFTSTHDFKSKMDRGLAQNMNKLISDDVSTSGQSLERSPELGEYAKRLLREAIHDPSGSVMNIGAQGGQVIRSNNVVLLESSDPREKAKWAAAIDSLVRDGLLEPTNHKKEFLKVTMKGYNVGDGI